MAEDDPMGIGKEALQNGASYFIQKPLSPFDVAYLWQHIVHRTSIIPGDMDTLTKQKMNGLTRSYEGNGKRRKIQHTEGRVTGTSILHNNGLYNNTRMIYTSSVLSTNILEIFIALLFD